MGFTVTMIDIDDGKYSRDGHQRQWLMLTMGIIDGGHRLTMGITDDGHRLTMGNTHDGHYRRWTTLTMGNTDHGYH